MTQHQALKIKLATSRVIAAVVVVLAAGAFLYASHATIASYVTAQPTHAENALGDRPAASGMNSSDALLW